MAATTRQPRWTKLLPLTPVSEYREAEPNERRADHSCSHAGYKENRAHCAFAEQRRACLPSGNLIAEHCVRSTDNECFVAQRWFVDRAGSGRKSTSRSSYTQKLLVMARIRSSVNSTKHLRCCRSPTAGRNIGCRRTAFPFSRKRVAPRLGSDIRLLSHVSF